MRARNSVSRTAVDPSLEAPGKPSVVCTLRITELRARLHAMSRVRVVIALRNNADFRIL
jgi:hypothetical protein